MFSKQTSKGDEVAVLSPTDILNIVCFVITTIVVVTGILIAKKMKLPCWKFQVAWIVVIEIIAVFLLVSRLTNV